MRQVTVLDNSMFDDGSFECFNFWLSDQDGTNQVDHSMIETLGVKDLVLERMSKGETWLNLRGQELVYGGLLILEIQWG